MAEEAVAYILEAVGYAAEDAAAYAATIVEYGGYALTAASIYTTREQQMAAEQRAKDAYNASLRDRYIMQRSATQQRSMVLGRARVSGPMVFTKSYGTSSANLVFIVALAAHECDAVEAVYFDDQRLVIDGGGNVISTLTTEKFSIGAATASYTLSVAAGSVPTAVASYDTGDVVLTSSLSSDGLTCTVSGASATKVGALSLTYQPQKCIYTPQQVSTTTSTVSVVSSDGSGSYTAPGPIVLGSVSCLRQGWLFAKTDQNLPFTVSGSTIHFTGATPGDTVFVTFQTSGYASSRARVRIHLGAAGQTADSRLVSLLPSYWSNANVGNGICYLVVELDYDPDSFPGGLPNVSAVVRGLKCFDPRTSTTAWTDNPALLMRGFWLHPLGGNRSTTEVDDTSVIAAANACDTASTYNVGSHSFARPLYRASTVAAKDRRAQDVLNDLAAAMGGRWAVLNNTLRIRAGAYSTPVAAIDDSWLHDGTAVQVQPRRNRADLINSTIGTFADETHDWQVVNYPKVSAAAYITADGRELASDVHYAAVTFSGQCQFLSAAAIRYARAGLTVKFSAKMHAFPLEVFDVVTLSLLRFGWLNKTFEVIESSFSLEGLIDLTLKEIDPSIWTLDAAFNATDYALKTNLPTPWFISPPVLNAPVSGTAQLLKQSDGTIVSRVYVSWAALTDPNVLNGGSVEVQWQGMGDTDWQSLVVTGDAVGTFLAPVADRRAYVIRARCRNRLASSPWSTQVTHVVVGKTAPPSDVAGLAASIIPGAVHITWTQCTDVDYDYTVLRVGASWAAGTPLPFNRPGTSYDWMWPSLGTYTIWAAHIDTTGNASANPQSCAVTVDASMYIGASSITPSSGWLNSNVGAYNMLWGAQNGPWSVGAGTYGVVFTMLKDSSGNPFGLQPGDVLTVSADLWQDATSAAASQVAMIYLYAQQAGGAWTVSASPSGATQTQTGSRASASVTLPSNASDMAAVGIGLWHQGGSSNTAGTVYADRIQVERGPTATQYKPGGQPGATRNAVTYGASAPSSPVDGDIWIDTSVTPRTIHIRLGGAWQLAGTYVNGTASITDDAHLGLTSLWSGVTGTGKPADNATQNQWYFQDADPGSVADGSIWVSSTKSWLRVAGAWQPYVGIGSIDTAQLVDKAAADVSQVVLPSWSWNNAA